MKKIKLLILSLAIALTCCLFAACADKSPVTANEYTVKITATNSAYYGKSLKEYMDFLQDDGKLTYTIEEGFVTSINGKSNTLTSYWMLYTDDDGHTNIAWGTFDDNGKIYGSAALGATELPVVEGCVYVWTYQTF